MRTRLHSGDPDTRAIQSLASRAWPAGWHPGGLGWALARGELGQQVLLVDDDAGTMVGWAAFGQHGADDVLAQADAECEDAAPALVAWLLDNVDAPRLSLEVNDDDEPFARAARRAGFRADPGARVAGMFCDVQHRADVPAAGFEVRAVRDDEFEPRVAVHRAAWHPASLPWADGREVDPSAESKFDAAAYLAVRATWLYDQDLDLVAVSPDGSLVGCCIAWFDAASGVAEIEPLGVVPHYRGMHIAALLCGAVAERVRALGGNQLFINTGPQSEYPAPSRAYLRAGFQVVDRAKVFSFDRAR